MKCRICGRPGAPVGLQAQDRPAGDSDADRALCRWHRAADTRRARRIEALTERARAGLDRFKATMGQHKGEESNRDA